MKIEKKERIEFSNLMTANGDDEMKYDFKMIDVQKLDGIILSQKELIHNELIELNVGSFYFRSLIDDVIVIMDDDGDEFSHDLECDNIFQND